MDQQHPSQESNQECNPIHKKNKIPRNTANQGGETSLQQLQNTAQINEKLHKQLEKNFMPTDRKNQYI